MWYGYESMDEYLGELRFVTTSKIANNPVRHSVFCVNAGKCKLVFKTKKKADKFLRLNRDNILADSGYAPIRSYYCSSCCGWHLTSRDKKYNYDVEYDALVCALSASLREDLESFYESEEDISDRRQSIYSDILRVSYQNLETCMNHIRDDEFSEAEVLLIDMWRTLSDYDFCIPIIGRLVSMLKRVTNYYIKVTGYVLGRASKAC